MSDFGQSVSRLTTPRELEQKVFYSTVSLDQLPTYMYKDYVYDLSMGYVVGRKWGWNFTYDYLMTRDDFNGRIRKYDRYMQKTLETAVAESKHEILTDIKGRVASEEKALTERLRQYDDHMQATLKSAVEESKREILTDIKGIIAREVEALTPSLIQAVQGEFATTLQHLKSAISSRFDEDVQELKVSEEQPNPPLRQSLERLDQRHSTVLQSLQEKVDRSNAELVEFASTLQHLKSAISSRFDEDVQELKVSEVSDEEEQPNPPLRQSLERLDQRHSTVLQSLQEKVDRANAELVESMCLSALESNHMMDLKRAVQFARDVNMVNGPQYMAATAWLDDLSVNAFTSWTFATSNFKALYDPTISKLRRDLAKPGALPSSGSALLAVVKNFLLVRSRTAGKAWRNVDVEACLQALATSCNTAITALGGPSAVTVQDWASFIWTTPDTALEACGALREFCFLMSEAYRDDDEEALRALLPFILVMNSTLVSRGDPTRHDLWPVDHQGSPVRQSYRGTGIPTTRLAWFKVIGRNFRVPFNLASALAVDTAKTFAERSVSVDASKTGVIFRIKFTDSLETPAACMHVSLMRRSVIPTELEFLFAAYSIFTIIDYEERRGGLLTGDWLYVDLEAAEDNKGSEHMPLAQWM